MDGTRALIVADLSEGTRELAAALTSEGYQVEQIEPPDLAARSEVYGMPDLLLACAAMGPEKVAVASLEFAVDGGEAPTTVVFLEDDDFDQLQSCVRAGYDYVMPPFLPGLLHARLTSCWERRQMRMASQKVAGSDSLHEVERQLSVAHQIQSGFLPDQMPILNGWQLATRFRPAKEVSGDFYDAFKLANSGRYGLVVADVCDKGVPAAIFMVLIRTLLRHTAEHTDEMGGGELIDGLKDVVETMLDGALRDGVQVPELHTTASPLVQAVASTNSYLARHHLRQGYFATMFFGLLDPRTGSFLYINGGHNPPVLARANGEWNLIEPTGPAVGMLENSVFTLGHLVLRPGDNLFVYSDGVTDARDVAGEFFGMERLLELVSRADAAPSADELVGLVDGTLKQHVGHAQQYDDITMMAIRNVQPVPAS